MVENTPNVYKHCLRAVKPQQEKEKEKEFCATLVNLL